MGLPALPGVSGSDWYAPDRANGVVSGIITGIGPSKAFSAWGPLNLVLYGSRIVSTVTTAGSVTVTPASLTGMSVGDSISSTVVPPGSTIATVGGSTVTVALAPQAWPGMLVVGLPSIAINVDASKLLPNGKTLATLVGATITGSPYFTAGQTVTVTGVSADGASVLLNHAPTSAPRGANNWSLIWFNVTANAITAGTDALAVFTGPGANYQPTLTGQIERSFDGGATYIGVGVGFGGAASLAGTLMPYSIAFGDPEASVLYRINVSAYTANGVVVTNYRISTTGQAAVSLSVPAIM